MHKGDFTIGTISRICRANGKNIGSRNGRLRFQEFHQPPCPRETCFRFHAEPGVQCDFFSRYVLGKEVENIADTVRAKRGQKLPVVFSIDEVKRLLDCMSGRDLLVAGLLYGAGLRLMELARLRIKDIDIDMDLNTITVRSGKGDKERTTILPTTMKDQLKNHLMKVRSWHKSDLSRGYGEVHLPDALSRQYPNAGKEWAWQSVFPANRFFVGLP